MLRLPKIIAPFCGILACSWACAAFQAAEAATPVAAKSAVAKGHVAKLETFVKADGEGFFALSLSPNLAQPPSPPRQLAVIFDTSASQTGAYRETALAALEALLADQTASDRVALLAADVNTVPLTPGFVPVASKEMREALNQLRQRVPLGATDMGAAITAAADLQSASDAAGRVRRIAYLGDGVSSAKLISPAQMRRLADRCAELQSPVSCYAVGPRVDLQLLGALAKNTGGLVVLNEETPDGRRAGAELADAVRGMVVWPTSIKLPENLHETYYRGVPPLRFDRDTVVLGSFAASDEQAKQPLPIGVVGKMGDKPLELHWQATMPAPNNKNSFLAELVKLAQRDGGVSLPTAGSATLWDLRKVVNGRAQGLTMLSQQALALGDLPQAQRLASQASEIDPANPSGSIVRDAVRIARTQASAGGPQELKLASRQVRTAASGEKALGGANAAEADGELLDEVERQQRVYRQFLRTEVRNVINQARQTMAFDPESATNMLKLVLEKVTQAPEVEPQLRDQLTDQIEAALRAASEQALVKSERDLRAQQRAAEGEAQRRINQELFLQEQKVDQLMARFNSLMDEERYRDAEAVADIAETISPNTPGLRDAELTARMVGYTADITAVVDARHKALVDSLFQTELALIPTPDEPPILYPDPEVWQLLTERRKKYKAVDLTQSNPNEAKIVAALDDKTELEFVDQPLSDVVEYLRERHDIEIQLDNKALTDEGIGSDTPVTRTIKGITLRSALRLMLGEMDLTYVIRNEVLMITTKTEAENMLSTKVYPVADLVIPITNPMMGRMGGRGAF
ncbi:MAG TPA: hypothetical protein VMV10_06595 [Pirellulales bacterium]|nr:hypothetical protein [Pirellulales bacterium]